MNGVLAKVFTLFNQTRDDMNQGCFVFKITSFTTDNRGQTSTDGKIENVDGIREK